MVTRTGIATVLALFLLVILPTPTIKAQQSTPQSEQGQKLDKKIDQTGIKWVMPFSEALKKAKTEKRILAIKMIAFGTDKSGCW